MAKQPAAAEVTDTLNLNLVEAREAREHMCAAPVHDGRRRPRPCLHTALDALALSKQAVQEAKHQALQPAATRVLARNAPRPLPPPQACNRGEGGRCDALPGRCAQVQLPSDQHVPWARRLADFQEYPLCGSLQLALSANVLLSQAPPTPTPALQATPVAQPEPAPRAAPAWATAQATTLLA